MKKNTIRLNESQLRQIVKETVKNVLDEVKILGKIDNFNRYKSYGKDDSAMRVNKLLDFTPNKADIDNEDTNGICSDDYYQKLAQQLTPYLRLTSRKEYNEIFAYLKDYIDNEREDLKNDYENFCDNIYMTCNTRKENGIVFYWEKDNPNDAQILPNMYWYCIKQLKYGR